MFAISRAVKAAACAVVLATGLRVAPLADGSASASGAATVSALPTIIRFFGGHGYRFVKL